MTIAECKPTNTEVDYRLIFDSTDDISKGDCTLPQKLAFNLLKFTAQNCKLTEYNVLFIYLLMVIFVVAVVFVVVVVFIIIIIIIIITIIIIRS